VQGAYIHNALNGVPHPTCKRPGKIFAVSLLEGALQPIIISFEKGGCFKKHKEWALCFSKHMLIILVYLSCDTQCVSWGENVLKK
jgi:hypothetical protein